MNILAFHGALGRDGNIESYDLSWWSHGASATLIADGVYVGSYTEERFTRIKNEGNFPIHSIKRLLTKANLQPNDIDVVAYVTDSNPCDYHLIKNKYYEAQLASEFTKAQIRRIDHHESHAACTFFSSRFESANVLTFDGAGDIHHGWATNTGTFSVVDDYGNNWSTVLCGHSKYGLDMNHVEAMKKTRFNEFLLGEFYHHMASVTWDILKQELNASHKVPRDTLAGKIMGLCAYGNASKVHMLKSIFDIKKPTTNCMPMIEVNPNRWIEFTNNLYDMVELAVAGQLTEITAADIAAWVQQVFEDTIVDFFKAIPKSFLRPNLCLGGGCALNILANQKIASLGMYDNIFIHPATGDEGLSFGAAMIVANQHDIKVDLPTNAAMVGPSYSNPEVHNVIRSCNDIDYQYCPDNEIYDIAAAALQDNKIVAWHQGRSEFGPRALGNRSIFANPSFNNKDMLNTKIKKREYWRPYAAMVMQEDLHEWVDIPRKTSEYMLFAGYIKPDKRSLVPGVVHEDNTCRVQSVTSELNDKAYRLLQAFKSKTQIPMLLNTSFNTIPSEPIVETPYDAIKSFLYSDIDMLVMGDYIITKKVR